MRQLASEYAEENPDGYGGSGGVSESAFVDGLAYAAELIEAMARRSEIGHGEQDMHPARVSHCISWNDSANAIADSVVEGEWLKVLRPVVSSGDESRDLPDALRGYHEPSMRRFMEVHPGASFIELTDLEAAHHWQGAGLVSNLVIEGDSRGFAIKAEISRKGSLLLLDRARTPR